MAQLVKNPPAIWETWVLCLGWEDSPGEGKVFWPGEFHGLYSPWGHKESDTTERPSPSLFIHIHTHTPLVKKTILVFVNSE